MAQEQQIQIKASDEVLKGAYSNAMQVSHTVGEFTLDFMNILAGAGSLVSRVIVSPDHLKRIVAALQDNLQKYEQNFGSVKAAPVNPAPSAPSSTGLGMGFDTTRSE